MKNQPPTAAEHRRLYRLWGLAAHGREAERLEREAAKAEKKIRREVNG